MTLILVERLETVTGRLNSQPLWLVWVGIQKSLVELTPGRVVQSMLPLLIGIGSPAVLPKRRGNSDGWQTGKPRIPRCRYPVVKKGKGRFQNSSKSIN